MKTEQEFCSKLEEMLELDPGTINLQTKLSDINWDSMAVVMFIAMADNNFGVAVNASDTRDAKTISDLYALISK